MKKLKFGEYLPTKLVKVLNDVIKDEREVRSKDNYISIVALIYHHQMSDDSSYLHYSPLSVEYWRKVIGSHYSNYMSKLLSVDLIHKSWVQYFDDFGNSSTVLGYRINPVFINLNFSLIIYSSAKVKTTANSRHSKAINDYPLTRLNLNPNLIRMQKKAALVWIDSHITSIFDRYLNLTYGNGLPTSLTVLVRIYKGDIFKTSHMSIESAQEIAEQQGKHLLYYKDKFIIAKASEFREIAIQNLKCNYNWQVTSFNPDAFNFSRNKNTLRVYSKLTSLPSSLLQFIRINGQYIEQADLKCSQFTLFANLINYYLNHSGKQLTALFHNKKANQFVSSLIKVFDDHKEVLPEIGLDSISPEENQFITNDVYKFMVDALLHDFYKVISSELALPLREHGKGIAFRTVFSKPKPENELVRQFRQLYPTVISIINDYKEKCGYNQFAIGLQRVEAEIFIDHIWKQAKKGGINCFTRHDSLVFPINKRHEIQGIIDKVFSSFNFIYHVEYEQFNTDEIMDRLVYETDYIDSVEEFDEISYYSMDMGEEENNTNRDLLREQLEEITLPEFEVEDYLRLVSLDTLFEIYELDGLTEEEKQSVEEDIANLQSNFPIPQFQDGTNNLISRLIAIRDE
jgi:hypothetical protein